MANIKYAIDEEGNDLVAKINCFSDILLFKIFPINKSFFEFVLALLFSFSIIIFGLI